MTTNDKEYQREYQREYRKTHPQKQYKKVKTEVKKVKVLENLHPPIEVGEKPVEIIERGLESKPSQHDSKPIIDFTRIANLSTFQRFLIEAIKISVPGFEGVTTRGKKETIAKEFNKRASDYRLVMTELKERLKELGK